MTLPVEPRADHGAPAWDAADAARRANRWVLISVVVLFVANGLQTLADPDLWGHLQFGLTHREEGHLARVDPYSYTAQGAAWTNHEWLTEWSFAVCYTWLGATGLMLLRAALLAATVTAVGVICLRRRLAPTAMVLLAMFGVSVMAQFFRVRPQMFTYALMAWLLVICDGHRPGKRLGLCFVPLIIMAWTNLHGGFVAGLGVFGVFWLGFVAEAWRHPQRKQELTFLGGIMLAAWSATLINPYGIDYWKFVLHAITLPRPAITEWLPVFAHNQNLVMIYLVAAITPAVFWLYSTRRGAWAETAVFALGVVLAGKHVRHLPFLILFGTLVLSRRVPEVMAIWGPKLRRHLNAWLQAASSQNGQTSTVPWSEFGFFLLVLMAAVGGGWKLGTNAASIPRDGALVVRAEDYPVQAVEFMRQNGITGNLDCGFNWGEYCLFKLHPQCHIFCDGRYETVYPPEVSRLALTTKGEDVFRERLENYPTEIVLAPLDDAFGQWAAEHPEMVEIYRDATARLLLRRTPRTEGWIEAWQTQRLKTIGTTAPAHPFPA